MPRTGWLGWLVGLVGWVGWFGFGWVWVWVWLVLVKEFSRNKNTLRPTEKTEPTEPQLLIHQCVSQRFGGNSVLMEGS